nr:cysteine desulfurase, mitochondrial [Tanacetum cinerariifolium]
MCTRIFWYLQQHGFDVTYLRVKPDGLVDLSEPRNTVRTDIRLVSVMAALGKIPIDVKKWSVSLMSLSGQCHKVYSPKGVGALYMRRRPRIRVEPQMNGGGQKRGIRSGLFICLIVGMGMFVLFY